MSTTLKGFRVLALLAALIGPSTASAVLPAPTAPTSYACRALGPTVLSANPATASPLGILTVSGQLALLFELDAVNPAVDLYIAAELPDQSIWLLNGSGQWQSYPAQVPAFRSQQTAALALNTATQNLFLTPLSGLPPGTYKVYTVIVPAGTDPNTFQWANSPYYLWCFTHVVAPSTTITKPTGVYSSSGSNSASIYANPNLRGALIGVLWSDIEPSPGVFNLTPIIIQANNVKANGKKWSLAIAGGGTGSPSWLIDQLGVPYIAYSFRGVSGYRLPLYWDLVVQERINQLVTRLAQEFNNDSSLQLVYVMQMSANGNEGHLQGVDMTVFKNAGYTDDRWVEAAKQAARSYADAFSSKAIAFEVHEVNGNSTVPSRIINDLWNDVSLGQRVGAAMWWISGKTSYQPALINVLKAYPGDIYGQAIGRSDDTSRFENGDYATVFAQAKEIGLRYIEPWEYEFKYGANTANGRWDATFADFNTWADSTF